MVTGHLKIGGHKMLYSKKSKFNRQEIKVQLIAYLEGIFTDIQTIGPNPSGYYFTHFFSGRNIKTGDIRYLKVTFRGTDKWPIRLNIFSVEFLTYGGHWERL